MSGVHITFLSRETAELSREFRVLIKPRSENSALPLRATRQFHEYGLSRLSRWICGCPYQKLHCSPFRRQQVLRYPFGRATSAQSVASTWLSRTNRQGNDEREFEVAEKGDAPLRQLRVRSDGGVHQDQSGSAAMGTSVPVTYTTTSTSELSTLAECVPTLGIEPNTRPVRQAREKSPGIAL